MSFARLLPRFLLPAVALGLTGCSAGTASRTPTVAATSLSGHAMGGQQPISGSTVQLYAVGTSGNGSAATPLLSPALTTDSSGGFDLTGKYHCDASTDLLYLVATGGNPGLSSGTNNAKIAMMSALGSCGSLPSISYLTVNELTTSAAIFTLSPFMTSPTQIGASGDDPALRTAFTGAQTAVDITTGVAQGSSSSRAQINTIANIMASCVNSAGNTSACNNLAQYTGNATNIANAALYMAAHPSTNVSQLFSNELPNSPFQPELTTPPAQWSIVTLPAAATPVITADTSAGSSATVTITSATSDAVIHYTVDGTTPTAGSFTYTSPFVITSNSTIEAIASSANTSWSDVGSKNVVIQTNSGGATATGIAGPVGTARVFFTEEQDDNNLRTDCAGTIPAILEASAEAQHRMVATANGLAHVVVSFTGAYTICNFTSLSGNYADGQFGVHDAGYSYGAGSARTAIDDELYTLAGGAGYVKIGGPAPYVLGPSATKYIVTPSADANGNHSAITIAGTTLVETGTVVDGIAIGGIIDGLSADSDGNLYFIDDSNHRVLKRTVEGALSVVAGTGNATSSGDGGSPLSAGMTPLDVAVDTNGAIYISDVITLSDQIYGIVRKVSNGVINTIAGGGTTSPPLDGTAVALGSAALNQHSLSVSPSGSIIYLGGGSDEIDQLTISH